jgi:hypothetical protein
VERQVRKVYDHRGRHWQSVVFLRRVSQETVRKAARQRPALPSLALLAAVRPGLGDGDSDDALRGSGGPGTAGVSESDPALDGAEAMAAAHARLAAATRRLFAPHVAAAARAGRAPAGGGGALPSLSTRAWFMGMARLVAGGGGSGMDSDGLFDLSPGVVAGPAPDAVAEC